MRSIWSFELSFAPIRSSVIISIRSLRNVRWLAHLRLIRFWEVLSIKLIVAWIRFLLRIIFVNLLLWKTRIFRSCYKLWNWFERIRRRRKIRWRSKLILRLISSWWQTWVLFILLISSAFLPFDPVLFLLISLTFLVTLAWCSVNKWLLFNIGNCVILLIILLIVWVFWTMFIFWSLRISIFFWVSLLILFLIFMFILILIFLLVFVLISLLIFVLIFLFIFILISVLIFILIVILIFFSFIFGVKIIVGFEITKMSSHGFYVKHVDISGFEENFKLFSVVQISLVSWLGD